MTSAIDIRARVLGDQTVPHQVIAFCRRHSLLAAGNRATRPGGKWTHTALWDEERECFNEALMFKGVVETSQEHWFDNYSAVELIAAACPDPRAGIEWARSVVGEGYDYSGAFSVPFRGDWQQHRRKYCSEKETLVMHRSGRLVFRDPGRGIHPHDLWRALAPAGMEIPL